MTGSAKARLEHGRRQRDVISRVRHGDLRPKERSFAALDALLASAKGRLEKLLPLKYARMSVSPFAFFRGAVAIMAADLGRLPRTSKRIKVALKGQAADQRR